MRVIVLRPWSYYRAFIVVVILITDVPIKPVMQLDRQPRFRRLKAHGIRSDQRSGISRRISYTIPLAIIFIDSIRRKQRRAWSNTGHRFYEEEVVPHEVQAVAQRMPNVVEEVLHDRSAVNPMVIVTRANREPRSRGPIK